MRRSVLFVCTGNTCRSFMAEYLLRHYAAKSKLEIDVASAGLGAFTGDTATEQAVEVLTEMGIDGTAHRSRKVHPNLLAQYDLIFPMTLGHKRQLLDLVPELAGKVFLLKEFAERVNPGKDPSKLIEKDHEISDPFGQSVEIYRQSRIEIDRAVQAIVEYFLEGEEKMKVAVGADHGGFRAKQAIMEHLKGQGFELEDFGTDSEESCDYPDIAHKLSRAVSQGDFDLGILICGTGLGMSMAANKVPGIRAALCTDTFSARMARSHNDSNVLCLGARVTGLGLMLDIVDTYLQGSFSGGRHGQRVDKIERV